MNAIDAIQTSLTMSKNLVNMFLGDLSDADLLIRPVPGANHIAWQVGHFTQSEHQMISKYMPGGTLPALPAGFADQHGKEGAAKDTGFLAKKTYLDTFNSVRDAVTAVAAKFSEADLDKPTGWDFAPTIGALLLLTSTHAIMHLGQFTVVRRKLGKPVLF